MEGNSRLFRDLVSLHEDRLRAFVLRHIGHPDDADDITQQAFVEAAASMATFRGESQLSTWLYGIAMNLVRNYLSRAPHRVHRIEGDEALEGVSDEADTLEQQLDRARLLARLTDELAALAPEMREVLLLVAVDQLSYEEAAALLAIPVGTVRSRVSRARAMLKDRMGEEAVSAL